MEDGARGFRLRRGRCSEAGRIYLITTVTHHRKPWFADLFNARRVICTMMEADERGAAETLAYVVMPDHLHWLFALGTGFSLSRVVGSVKSLSAHRIGHRVWQAGFHDHALRRDEDLKPVARYVVANPIRAGLVSSLRDYSHWDAAWL